ncbi:hypothetical protein QZH41_010510 [Actinostola sp. cb2023]|nr:hypothetical protein QZH41_010510 [Actinostola sp. cb2023]
MHEPFERLSDRQIRKARLHITAQGPGTPTIKKTQHRVRIDKAQLDHFLEFTTRPYFYQDVAYGSRTIKLDSGEELPMPNVVRTVARCTIIHQYLEFCMETEFEPMSRSTMWRVLEVQEASQRKSLQGLDNTAADGADGFEALLKIVDNLEEVGSNTEWCSLTRKKLHAGKLYLKTNYRAHCQNDSSQCPDHCRPFALSDPEDSDYKTVCDHTHDLACTDCESLADAVQDVQSEIRNNSSRLGKEKEEDLQYDANAATKKIFDWKAHVLRAQNQEESKHVILKSLGEEEVLIIVDWAMKFTAMKFREKQAEWYGKKGMNWHISSSILKEGQKMQITSHAHLFNNCRQDWYAVLSILESLLVIIKTSHTSITKAYLRSDEAGCYHNSQLMASLQQLAKRHGIQIVRYDHSEPQYGKDVCDRILCPMKAAIRRYCNEGHDIVCAEDMHNALKQRPVEGTTAAVCGIQEQNISLQINKIPNYSSLHSFEFTPDGLRVWKAYNVGVGKLIPWDTIITHPQGATHMAVDVPFFSMKPREIKEISKSRAVEVGEDCKHECPDPKCREEFDSRAELELHLTVIGHHMPVCPVKESLYDNLRRDWVQRFQSVSLSAQPVPLASYRETGTDTSPISDSRTMGWALHKNRGCGTRFSSKVREYLERKFEIGQATGRKEDPAQVAKDMRTACTTEGSAEEAAHSQDLKNDSDSVGEQDGSTEEYAQIADEEQLRETSEAVLAVIGITHPVMYDVYDLCTMKAEQKLASFKVKMLMEICSYFELPYNYKDTKSVLIGKVTGMISDCSCRSNK